MDRRARHEFQLATGVGQCLEIVENQKGRLKTANLLLKRKNTPCLKPLFYTHVAQPAAFACRLIARAIRDGGQILVWSDSVAAVQQLDVDLWQQIPRKLYSA